MLGQVVSATWPHWVTGLGQVGDAGTQVLGVSEHGHQRIPSSGLVDDAEHEAARTGRPSAAQIAVSW